MTNYLRSMLEIFGVVFLRFRPLPRLWNVWLVGVNLTCLYFIRHVEAQVVLATTGIAVLSQAAIHQKIGFTRLLGITHILWIPMFVWIAARIPSIREYPDLHAWLAILFVTNLVSFLVDTLDVGRFVRGERDPHYSWS